MPEPAAEQLAPELEWILLQGERQFVDETLVEEGRMRMADRTPEADWHRAVRRDRLQAIERKAVGRILDGIAFRLALLRQSRGSRRELVGRRLADLALADGYEISIPEIGGPSRERHRSIAIVADILFARPQHLHRVSRQRERAGHGLAHQVDFSAPAEAAA